MKREQEALVTWLLEAKHPVRQCGEALAAGRGGRRPTTGRRHSARALGAAVGGQLYDLKSYEGAFGASALLLPVSALLAALASQGGQQGA